MIKIKKLLINNFKGIENQIIIDFSKSESKNLILSGPNGYGKTTIFEALELCITGNFDRVRVYKNIQFRNKDRSKPFFQNNEDENVVVQLVIDKDGEEYLISKLYDIENSPEKNKSAKKHLPEISQASFFTYLSKRTEAFGTTKFNQDDEVEQPEIDSLFLGEKSNITLNSVYYLFNYIQQEQNIRFLKTKEDAKGESLSFLFDIDKEEWGQKQLNELIQNFDTQKGRIGDEIDEIKKSDNDSEDVAYIRLFKRKEFEIDKETPFKNLKEVNNHLNSYLEEVDQLIKFKNNFDVKEYEKSRTFSYINDNLLPDDKLLNLILLSNLISTELLDKIELKNKTISKYKRFISNIEEISLNDENAERDEIVEHFLEVDSLEKYKDLKDSIKDIDKDLGRIGKVITELIDSNKKVWENFNKANSFDNIDEKSCPVCSSTFDSYEVLNESYKQQIESLRKFNNEKISVKEKLLAEIKKLHHLIKEDIQKYLNKNKLTESYVLSLIREYSNYEKDILKIKEVLLNPENEHIGHLYFTSPPFSSVDFNENRHQLKTIIEAQVLKKYKYNSEKTQDSSLYSTYFDSNKEILNNVSILMLEEKKKFLLKEAQKTSNKRHNFLTKRLKKLNSILENLILINNKVFKTIKDHQVDMIEKIKIPFFIYSGKILQNYQQGFGIFIDIKPTGKKNNVVFRTGCDSDHDIVFHLSAGQMAVVSLAFTLSLNKVYNTNENFKLLAIDDPVQTMDSLNIHSFVDLLRNEFTDYQIITSTHDDFTSRYMKYKFEKYDIKTSIQNVQNLVLEQTYN
ncbi:hypothetical protein CAP47_11385 [Psychroflexus sp. S27]|uniref:AAA family ATPase n=1 Tax=Psychroflexus sp. S27 TaxID=1982757 RepID=UPI000C2AD03C|nr:AAA family ATPase [Psychroflexus sp. S27]PJX20128.1 hypothetical protein CAP47_11385 [Psychroflexus sp. S27]